MTKVQNLSARRYDLDQLRVYAILLLHLFHVGMFFNTWGWHVKNNETAHSFEYIMIWMHQWRMQLLLLISGAGTIFASSRRTTKQFAKERTKRLLIPLIFSMLVIVPPQIYFERISQFTSYWDFYKTVFDFVPYPAGGSLSWHHMWFVLYLFCYSLLSVPLIIYLKSDKSKKFISRIENYLSMKFGILSFIFVILFTQGILGEYFPEETHGLIDDWAYFSLCFLYFLAGIIIASSDRIWDIFVERRKFHLLTTLISLALMEFLYNYDWHLIPVPEIFVEKIWDINELFIGLSTAAVCLGYGRKYLNKNTKWLKPFNEAVYPFYILHQTVIIALAFPMTNWEMNLYLKFILLTIVSFIATVSIYLLFIKPFNPMRFLFGMKPKVKIASDLETAKV